MEWFFSRVNSLVFFKAGHFRKVLSTLITSIGFLSSVNSMVLLKVCHLREVLSMLLLLLLLYFRQRGRREAYCCPPQFLCCSSSYLDSLIESSTMQELQYCLGNQLVVLTMAEQRKDRKDFHA